jgi:hypothetical protein
VNRRGGAVAGALALVLLLGQSALAGSQTPRGAATGSVQRPALGESASEVLRRVRAQRERPVDDFVAELTALGPVVIEPLLDVRSEHVVPALAETDKPQILSSKQREVLLRTLAAFEPRPTLRSLEARLAAADTLPMRCAALWGYSAVGESRHLPVAIDLAWREDEEKPPKKLDEAFRAAVTGVLSRDPSGFLGLAHQVLAAPPVLHVPLVMAIGATRDPRGQDAYAQLLQFHPELAAAITAQARLLGTPIDPETRTALGAALARYLDPEVPQLCAAVARALGEIEDEDSLPKLIELLESENYSVRDNAHWALKRCSRLAFPAAVGPWERWYAEQSTWWNERAERLFDDLEQSVRLRRLLALEELGRAALYRDEIADHVAPLLTDGDVLVRRRACDTLRELDVRCVGAALMAALDDSDEEVRVKSRAALESIFGVVLPPEIEGCRKALRL